MKSATSTRPYLPRFPSTTFEVLAYASIESLTPSEIAHCTGAPASTVHSLVSRLRKEGLIERSAGGKVRASEVGRAYYELVLTLIGGVPS